MQHLDQPTDLSAPLVYFSCPDGPPARTDVIAMFAQAFYTCPLRCPTSMSRDTRQYRAIPSAYIMGACFVILDSRRPLPRSKLTHCDDEHGLSRRRSTYEDPCGSETAVKGLEPGLSEARVLQCEAGWRKPRFVWRFELRQNIALDLNAVSILTLSLRYPHPTDDPILPQFLL